MDPTTSFLHFTSVTIFYALVTENFDFFNLTKNSSGIEPDNFSSKEPQFLIKFYKPKMLLELLCWQSTYAPNMLENITKLVFFPR